MSLFSACGQNKNSMKSSPNLFSLKSSEFNKLIPI